MRRIEMTVSIPRALILDVDNPDDPEDGFGWQVVRVEEALFQSPLGPDITEHFDGDDFDELDRLANAAEDDKGGADGD